MSYVVFPQNSYAEALTPGLLNQTVLGDGAFKEVITVKWGRLGGAEVHGDGDGVLLQGTRTLREPQRPTRPEG